MWVSRCIDKNIYVYLHWCTFSWECSKSNNVWKVNCHTVVHFCHNGSTSDKWTGNFPLVKRKERKVERFRTCCPYFIFGLFLVLCPKCNLQYFHFYIFYLPTTPGRSGPVQELSLSLWANFEFYLTPKSQIPTVQLITNPTDGGVKPKTYLGSNWYRTSSHLRFSSK